MAWTAAAREASALARQGHKLAQSMWAAHQSGVVAIKPNPYFTNSFNKSLSQPQAKAKSGREYVPISRVGSRGQVLH